MPFSGQMCLLNKPQSLVVTFPLFKPYKMQDNSPDKVFFSRSWSCLTLVLEQNGVCVVLCFVTVIGLICYG